MGNSLRSKQTETRADEEAYIPPEAAVQTPAAPIDQEQAPLTFFEAELHQMPEIPEDPAILSAAPRSDLAAPEDVRVYVDDRSSQAASIIEKEAPIGTECPAEVLQQEPAISIDTLLREAGLLDQLVMDKEDKAGRTAYNRILKFLDYCGVKFCASIEAIPGALISLSPGSFTTYPSFLERAKTTPSTVTQITIYFVFVLFATYFVHNRFITSLGKSNTLLTGSGVDFT
jgi:hypothetical protein